MKTLKSLLRSIFHSEWNPPRLKFISRLSPVVLALAFVVSARAQSVTVTNIVYETNYVATPGNTNTYAQLSGLSAIWQDVKGATNYAIAPYLTYAPKAPTKFGGGILGIYNVNNYVGAAIGLDWLGGFSLVSGNIELKLPVKPLANYGYTNLIATPFAIGGIATPYSGAGQANGSLASIEGVGASVDFAHLWGGTFGVGGALVNWTSSGAYSGKHYQAFVKWSRGF